MVILYIKLLLFFYLVTTEIGKLHSFNFSKHLADEDEDGPTLPTKSDEEFKPFIRRLPEFKFW